MQVIVPFVILLCFSLHSISAEFGWTVARNGHDIDSGAGLVFRVHYTSDIISINYKGIQVQSPTRFSHVSSGLAAAVNITTISNFIKVTLTTDTLTHYYIIKEGENNIYMGTYTTQEPGIGELRYIARLLRSSVPNGFPESDIVDATTIESEDIFKSIATNETKSKFYSGVRFIDDQIHGVTGDNIGVYMIIPEGGYEGSSGGPFFRDINNQGTSNQEVYFYMNSGHTQTEAYRMGFHGPYLLSFTDGPAPSLDFNFSFYESLDLLGYVPKSGRGYVSGKASGFDLNKFECVVGFKNTEAQYWAKCSVSDGSYSSPPMKPGEYIVTLFKSELEVATDSVVIVVGKTVTLNIASAEIIPNNSIFQIGEFDGTPKGFMNADKIERAHPSDFRMEWTNSYTVGDPLDQFPMCVFKAVNNGLTIAFNLTYVPRESAASVRVGITIAFAGGRPQIGVNSWTGSLPGPSGQPNSRGVTRGVWRGNNVMFTQSIPSGVLVNGTNTIRITVVSGSGGDGYLSANFVIDAVQLLGIAELAPENIPTIPPSPSPSPSPSLSPSNNSSSSNSSTTATIPDSSTSAPVASSSGAPILSPSYFIFIVIVALLFAFY